MENKRNRKEKVCNIAINDTKLGWFGESEENKKIYYLWMAMIKRCYDEKTLESRPTYKNVSVCDDWLHLSRFAEDIKGLENYDRWLNEDGYQLDKDILCDELNLENKIYSKNTCKFITLTENTQYMLSKRDYSYMKGENHPNFGKKLSEETKKKLSETKKGELNPMFGKSIPNKEQLVEINSRKIIAKCLHDGKIFRFKSIDDATKKLSEIEKTTFNSSQIGKICRYNSDPDGYYERFKKRAKQNKGFTFYYEEDYDGDE